MSDDELIERTIEDLRNAITKMDPPEDLERRVVADLTDAGAIRRERPPGSRWRFSIAAVIAVIAFMGGMASSGLWQRFSGTATVEDPRQTYVLLLRESESSAPHSEEEVRELVAEYGAWARERAAESVLVGGEKLDVGGVVLEPGNADPQRWTRSDGFIGGFFVVKARDYDEAAAIAKTCPHLRHGGTIEIRRIDPT